MLVHIYNIYANNRRLNFASTMHFLYNYMSVWSLKSFCFFLLLRYFTASFSLSSLYVCLPRYVSPHTDKRTFSPSFSLIWVCLPVRRFCPLKLIVSSIILSNSFCPICFKCQYTHYRSSSSSLVVLLCLLLFSFSLSFVFSELAIWIAHRKRAETSKRCNKQEGDVMSTFCLRCFSSVENVGHSPMVFCLGRQFVFLSQGVSLLEQVA